ncbi:ChbG/HpnK family deacetylase, partial [Salmonella enterica subsp. enterica serovar Typhimurium]|nr:ChbG/HpnK family deacetylase [Salmonella enterica subsp. enterica serovar Typhimurium]
MTRAPGWPAAASRIGTAGSFGLHLDFTEFSPLRRGLWPLIGASLAHRLDASALRDEIATQCALFEDATGRAPDYVDGHQHVHQLPQIREA